MATTATAAARDEATIGRMALGGVLSWVLPGLGHIFLGERGRGLILMVVVALTYWGGVVIGGIQSTVRPMDHKAWFAAQVCAGSHTVAAYLWARNRAASHPGERANFMEEETALIYTGVAGLLNVLIIFDALATADPKYVRPGARPLPRPGEG